MKLIPIEHKAQRVLTTQQLAESYETTSRRISENFNSNKERYQEGKHFFCLEGNALKEFRANTEIADLPSNLNKFYLWTEKGALLHAKSLATDKAWEVYDQLVETYFKAKDLQYQLHNLSGENLIALAVIEAQKVLEQKEATIKILSLENKQNEQIIGELKPKADYLDSILKNKGLVTITQIAKDYGMTGTEMNDLLHELKVQYKQSEQWLLYREHQSFGYTHSQTINITRRDGTPDVKMNTKWTQKGRLFLYNLLKSNGIMPIIEKEESEIHAVC